MVVIRQFIIARCFDPFRCRSRVLKAYSNIALPYVLGRLNVAVMQPPVRITNVSIKHLLSWQTRQAVLRTWAKPPRNVLEAKGL